MDFQQKLSFKHAKSEKIAANSNIKLLFQTMLKYKSDLFRACETLLYVPLMVMGYKEQKQDIEVELVSNYNQDPVCNKLGVPKQS